MKSGEQVRLNTAERTVDGGQIGRGNEVLDIGPAYGIESYQG